MQLQAYLESSALRFPEKTALMCGDQRLTFAQLDQQANRLAHALRQGGTGRGDRVAICLDNSAEAVVSIFAALKASAVFMPINPTTKADKLSFLMNNARPHTLILAGRKVAELADHLQEHPHPQRVIVLGEPPAAVAGSRAAVDSWESVLTACGDCIEPPPKQSIDIDLAALIYTSGSTGLPKGVMLTHLNMTTAATSITTYLRNTPDDILLSVLPLSFDYGLYQVLMAMRMGMTLVLEKSFTYPHDTLWKVVEHRVTGLPLVPTMLAILLQMDLSKYDLSHLRYVTNTGAALPVEHIRQLRRALPHVQVFSMYGLTECKRVAYLEPEEIDQRPASVGKAIPNTEVYLVDEQDQRVGPGETGKLVVRGAHVMKGYWENPQATAAMLKPGPLPGEFVLHTGDYFRTDPQGYLYFVGRKDDMIKSRGEKVSPREVEDVLYRLEEVAEAAVLGVADAVYGQAIKAILSLRPGMTLTDKQVQRHCARHLEDFMVPQIVVFRPSLPKNASGKIDKLALKQEGELIS